MAEKMIIWGPSMTGKSLLGLQLAAKLMNEGKAVIVMPMSEFSEGELQRRIRQMVDKAVEKTYGH